MRAAFAACLLLLAASARAGSLVLDGPGVLHVGDTASYSVRLVTGPDEHFGGGNADLLVENARALAQIPAFVCDCPFQQGFTTRSYIVDLAALVSVDPASEPFIMLGGKGSPIDPNDPGPSGYADLPDLPSGSYELFPFTLTALAPGELRFVPNPITTDPLGYDGAKVTLYQHPDGPGTAAVTQVIDPGSDGVFFRIEIVPETGLSLAAVLGVGTLLLRRRWPAPLR
ncbi:MAG TPA: hypothetical protein VMR50_05885 [Myxococcota bacterium]|nr:hypothetical protein [Myxococcota bacterium]